MAHDNTSQNGSHAPSAKPATFEERCAEALRLREVNQKDTTFGFKGVEVAINDQSNVSELKALHEKAVINGVKKIGP